MTIVEFKSSIDKLFERLRRQGFVALQKYSDRRFQMALDTYAKKNGGTLPHHIIVCDSASEPVRMKNGGLYIFYKGDDVNWSGDVIRKIANELGMIFDDGDEVTMPTDVDSSLLENKIMLFPNRKPVVKGEHIFKIFSSESTRKRDEQYGHQIQSAGISLGQVG